MQQINAALNLAFPIAFTETQVPDGDGKTKTVSTPVMWAYHTPISSEVFDANYRIIAATKDALFGGGAGYAFESGPRIARHELIDAAEIDAARRGLEKSAAPAFLAELRRLTMLLHGDPVNGFKPVPADIAIGRNLLSKDEWLEVESAIVFFTCLYAMARLSKRANVAESVASLFGGSITSSTLTDFSASLRTSTPEETSPESPTISSQTS